MTKMFLPLLCALALTITPILGDQSPAELTGDNFKTEMAKYDLVLVKFYAEWCGHCKRMAPDFAAAAKKLKESDPPVQLVKVNCPNNDALCKEFGVSGYPTLKIFRNGKFAEDYNGPRDRDGIVKFMKARSGPASTPLKSEDDIAKFVTKNDGPVFIALVSGEDDSLLKMFTQEAEIRREHAAFAHVLGSKKNAVRRYLPKSVQTKMEDDFAELKAPNSRDQISEWVLENWGGHLILDQGEQWLFNADKDATWVTIFYQIDYEKDPKGTNYVRNRLLKAIKALKSSSESTKARFIMSPAQRKSDEINQKYGVQWKTGDSPVAVATMKGKKYVMTDKFSYDSLKDFVKNLEAGKVPEHLKSEPVPQDQPDAVVKVVGKTFDEVVRAKKNVMVELYAPWCGHCKSLKPIYEDLAKKYADREDIVIAAVDATANDIPSDFSYTGFPTIYWADKDNKIKQYNSGRDLESFSKFIETEAGASAKQEL